MDSNGSSMLEMGPYQVHDLITRETPIQTMQGKTALSTIITFSVGPHGPFTLVYQGARPNAAQITSDIVARVNELRATDSAIAQLNKEPRLQ
jgi:hypothetical protein